MIIIDGSQGEGGGQILRSSLALSMVTGKPVTIVRVRAARKRPGLMRQHLAAVTAAKQISDAQIEGDQIGSEQLVFCPGTVKSGQYRWSIGSAGSTTLVFQTALPALMLADGVSRVELRGGTHNPLAPPFDFLAKAFAPQLQKIGPQVEPGECRPGFFPAGGGCCDFRVRPSLQLQSLHLLDRGALVGRRVRALVSNLPMHIGERECKTIARKTGWPERCFARERCVGSAGPGNVVMIELEYEHVTEVFIAFGELGKKAERVASEVLRAARNYTGTEAPVGQYLADQLMLPMALAARSGQAGSFRTSPLTKHSLTQVEVLQQFLDIQVVVENEKDGTRIVQFTGA